MLVKKKKVGFAKKKSTFLRCFGVLLHGVLYRLKNFAPKNVCKNQIDVKGITEKFTFDGNICKQTADNYFQVYLIYCRHSYSEDTFWNSLAIHFTEKFTADPM